MKKMIILIIGVFFISGCAVTSEQYKYKHRFDSFHNLLSDDEKASFRNSDYVKLGESLDKRASENKKLSADYSAVLNYEAISTFSGEQVAHFFKETILKELNRNNYYKFMKYLKADSQKAFVYKNGFMDYFNKLYSSNAGFKGFIESMKTEYRLYGFSNEQVIAFFRDISFKELSQKEFYYLLQVLKQCDALDSFLKGDITSASRQLDASIKKLISVKMLYESMMQRNGMGKIGTSDLLDIYYNIVMKEMDPYAVERTIEKF